MTTKKDDFGAYTPDELRELYKKDPERFDELAQEAKRRACTASSAEKSLRLQQMQWTIDMQLRKAKTPLGRMSIMENIFYDQVYGEDGQLEKLVKSCNSLVRALTGVDRLPDRKKGKGMLHRV